MFETDSYIIHQVTLRADDVIDISFSQKRFMFDWGYKTEIWTFTKDAVPDIELLQLTDSAGEVVNLLETKGRLGEPLAPRAAAEDD